MKEYSVTVYCLVYNHEKYVEDTLKGFINQKTNFNFKVIVHDDASTDNSASIIRQYEQLYPNIIKGIYQIENQYKKNTIIPSFIIPNLEGDYVAVCEGDDYWIDDMKLQKQYDYMNEHNNCSFCFSNAKILNMEDGKERIFIPYSADDAKFDLQDDYDLGDFYKLSFIPTASFFMRTELFIKCYDIYKHPCGVDDLRLRLFNTAFGYAHFMKEISCVYRENVPNSAMSKFKSEPRRSAYERNKKILKMIMFIDEYTDYKFHKGLLQIMKHHCESLFVESKLRDYKKNSLISEVMQQLPTLQKISHFVRLLVPKKLLIRDINDEKK